MTLTDDQTSAVRVALTSCDGVVAIQGFAGTGKTTAYEAMQNIYAALTTMMDIATSLKPHKPSVKLALSGQKQLEAFYMVKATLKGAAPTHAAVKELKDKKIEANTLSSILSRYDFNKANAPQALIKMRKEFKGTTLIIDEASMLGNRQLEQVFALQNDLKINKVILSGDVRQIASLQAGAPFKMGMTHNREMARTQLTTILRQNSNPTLKEAVLSFAQGKSSKAMTRLKPFIHELGRGANDALIADKAFSLWKGEGGKARVVVDTNKMRTLMNERIREDYIKDGIVSKDSFTQQAYSDAGLSNHDKMTSRLYQTGQTIYAFARFGKLKSGDTLNITSLNHRRNSIEGINSEGKSVKMDIMRSLKGRRDVPLGVYHQTSSHFAVGDRVLFNKTDKHLGIQTNDEYLIAHFDEKSVQLMALDGRTKALNVPREATQLQFMTYAYAITADKAQGKSFESVIAILKSVGQGDFVNHARAYIMASRAKDSLNLVTDSFQDLMRKVGEYDGINLVGLDNLSSRTTIQAREDLTKGDLQKALNAKAHENNKEPSRSLNPLESKSDLNQEGKGATERGSQASHYKSDGTMDRGDKQKSMERPQPERSL
jgi:hypothetical protein